jgi:lysophospholipase L1-like esterase
MKGSGQLLLGAVLLAVLTVGPALALEPGQSAPKRIYANGDSITRAVNANLPSDNLNLSWVSGYFGFWQQLFGLPNIQSHNQRISANFGEQGRKNWTVAASGARVEDFVSQASGAAGKGATYATVMLGANDVCRESIVDLPTDAEFANNFRAGMISLLSNLPDGATVQVVAIPDLKRLYDIGQDKTALGIVNCQVLWAFTAPGFPCSSMLSPSNTEADRQYVRSRNLRYNEILQEVTAAQALQYPTKFISFTDVPFTYQFSQREISNIDCYHPSWEGQKILARETWNNGFFKAYQRED